MLVAHDTNDKTCEELIDIFTSAAPQSVNAQDAKGWTALMHAVAGKNHFAVGALIKAKADPTVRNKEGKVWFCASWRLPASPGLSSCVRVHPASPSLWACRWGHAANAQSIYQAERHMDVFV